MRKWIRRTLLAGPALLVLAGAAFLASAIRTQRPVGFAVLSAEDPAGPAIPVAAWYPTEARPWPTTLLGLRLLSVARDAPVAGRDLPLVVFSQGNGGGPGSHADLATALAEAGFVAAAPLHAGDNFEDERAVGTAAWLPGRARELRAAVSHLLGAWSGRDRLAPGQVGLFGCGHFSFLAPCALLGPPALCQDGPGFDRGAFHREMSAAVIAFLRGALR